MMISQKWSTLVAVIIFSSISAINSSGYDNDKTKKMATSTSISSVPPSAADFDTTLQSLEPSNTTTTKAPMLESTSESPSVQPPYGNANTESPSLAPYGMGNTDSMASTKSESTKKLSPTDAMISTEAPISTSSPAAPGVSPSEPDIPPHLLDPEFSFTDASTMVQTMETTKRMETDGPVAPITSGHGKKNKKTRRPQTAAPTYPPVDFNCQGKSDGYYADPKDKCSSKFYACVGSIGFRMDCSSRDLVYEPDTGICERRQDSFRCTGVRKTSPKPTPRPPQPSQAELKLPIDCSKLDDGWHPDPEKKCSHVFYSCSNGYGSKFTCPGEMYFDKESGACEAFQDVVACAGKKKSTTLKPTAPTTPKEKVPIDCVNLPSGAHPDPTKKCSEIYYVCSNGDGWKRECPPGLIYDEKNKWCNYRDEIEACGGGQKKSTVTPTKPVQPSQASLISKEFDCKDKEDGSYLPKDKKCSADYFRCVAGSAYKVKCPNALFYDAEKDSCERWADLFVCSGKKPTSPKPSVATLQPKPTEKLPIDCGKHSDGDYPDPEKKCSSIYYTCSGMIGSRRKCPLALFFDKEMKLCETKEMVPDCSGKPRPTKPAPTIAQLPTKAPFNCELKDDGNYAASKCSAHYFSCIGGSATKGACPKGLFYDSELDECGYKNEIPACGGTRPSATSELSINTKPTKRPEASDDQKIEY